MTSVAKEHRTTIRHNCVELPLSLMNTSQYIYHTHNNGAFNFQYLKGRTSLKGTARYTQKFVTPSIFVQVYVTSIC